MVKRTHLPQVRPFPVASAQGIPTAALRSPYEVPDPNVGAGQETIQLRKNPSSPTDMFQCTSDMGISEMTK